MPSDTQDLTYNVTGQSFHLDVPEGTPSSITSVYVYPWDTGDDGTAETATTGSAAVDAVSTTTDAAAGTSQANAKLVPLTATTNIAIGREYIITSATGAREWVAVTEINAGVSVVARSPLLNDYASGATFKGARVSISVIDAWIQNSNKITDGIDPNPGWRVRWQYVVDSVTYVRATYADVVRYGGHHNISPADMAMYLGDWEDQLPINHRVDEGRGLIQEGYRLFQANMFAADLPDQQQRNQDVTDEAVKRAVNVVLQRIRYYAGQADETVFATARDEFDSFFAKNFSIEARIAMGTDESGAGDEVYAEGIWSR